MRVLLIVLNSAAIISVTWLFGTIFIKITEKLHDIELRLIEIDTTLRRKQG